MRISEWLFSGIKRGITWDRVIQRQKTGQEQSWKADIPLLEELSDKSHLRLNGMTHRLAARFAFAKLHFKSKVKKKRDSDRL